MKSVELKSKDVIVNINNVYKTLSKSHKKIADYIIANYDVVSFMTASVLASKVDTSESTVVRFANAVGYDGYPGLQEKLQRNIQRKLTLSERLEYSKEKQSKDHPTQVLLQDMDNIKHAFENIDIDVFDSAVEDISKARKVFVYGHRSTNVLADYMGFYLNMVLDDIYIIKESAQDSYDQLLKMSHDDVLIVLSFPRYSQKTYDIVDFANKNNVTMVGITDTIESPLTLKVKYCLYARYNMDTFLDSLVGPMSLINAIVIGLGMKDDQRIKNKIDRLETIWKDYNIYKLDD